MWDYFLAENCSFFHSPAAALAMFLFGFGKNAALCLLSQLQRGALACRATLKHCSVLMYFFLLPNLLSSNDYALSNFLHTMQQPCADVSHTLLPDANPTLTLNSQNKFIAGTKAGVQYRRNGNK